MGITSYVLLWRGRRQKSSQVSLRDLQVLQNQATKVCCFTSQCQCSIVPKTSQTVILNSI